MKKTTNKLEYFKDNFQDDDEADFDPQQYYYKRSVKKLFYK